MSFKKITENESLHKDLEQKSSLELLKAINQEDQKVADQVNKIIPSINKFIEEVIPKMKNLPFKQNDANAIN